jgi:class 3 adenylate cyclase
MREYVEFVTGEPFESTDRSFATVLFTDVAGSTQWAGIRGDTQWRHDLDALDNFVVIETQRRGGRIVKQLGDGHLAVFPSPTDAVHAGVALTSGCAALGLRLRIGVHAGDVEHREGGDVGGLTVHIANRIARHAPPGQVLVSRTVADLVAGAHFELREYGVHALKGVDGQWQLFAVITP